MSRYLACLRTDKIMGIICASMSLFLTTSCMLAQPASKPVPIVLSFDSPFPASPLKECLDTSMHMISDLALITPDLQADALCCAQDLLLGRVVHLAVAVDALYAEYAMGIRPLITDIEYLVTLLNHIMTTYAHIAGAQECFQSVTGNVLVSVHERLGSLLKKS
jgi:hypothetical protein